MTNLHLGLHLWAPSKYSFPSCNDASCQRNQDLNKVRNLFKVTQVVSGKMKTKPSLIPQVCIYSLCCLRIKTNPINQWDQAWCQVILRPVVLGSGSQPF